MENDVIGLNVTHEAICVATTPVPGWGPQGVSQCVFPFDSVRPVLDVRLLYPHLGWSGGRVGGVG